MTVGAGMARTHTAEIDTSPIKSVKEAAALFGGIGYWKPPKCGEAEEVGLAELKEEVLLKEAAALFGGIGYWKPPKRGEAEEVGLAELKEEVLLKEAAALFGGIGYWKPPKRGEAEEVGLAELKEEVLLVKKDVMVKEREAKAVLVELDEVIAAVRKLERKLEKEAGAPAMDVEAEKEKHGCNSASLDPGLVLMSLKLAKRNLGKTATDLVNYRAAVDWYSENLERERLDLEKNRERLARNSSLISALEEELNQTKLKMELAKKALENNRPLDVAKEVQRLRCGAEQYRKVGEAARDEIIRATGEIEQAKARVQTTETELVAARKMKDVAREAEAVALAEIKVASDPSDGITLSLDEYSTLVKKAREAGDLSKNSRVVDAMQKLDDANISKMDVLKKVAEATKELKTSERALQDALSRAESENRGKLALEEAVERRRRRASVKVKIPDCSSSHRRLDSRRLSSASYGSRTPVMKAREAHASSVGQIPSRRLVPVEQREESPGKVLKVTLGQMLGMKDGQFSGKKKKKFGFARDFLSCFF